MKTRLLLSLVLTLSLGACAAAERPAPRTVEVGAMSAPVPSSVYAAAPLGAGAQKTVTSNCSESFDAALSNLTLAMRLPAGQY